MKKLVVNADDFGLSNDINEGIIASYTNGIVTSASIMVNGEAFDRAVELSKKNPQLSVGIHLVLVDQKPVLSSYKVLSLINKEGAFFNDYKRFIRKYFWGQIKLSEIRNEFDAQIRKALDSGLDISHINSHQHLHILPGILKVTIELAIKYNIKWIRNSYDLLTRENSIGSIGLAFLAKRGKQKILSGKLRTSDYFLGTAYSGKLNEKGLHKILKILPSGLSELICHPGNNDLNFKARYKSWGGNWEQEKRALVSHKTKELIKRNNIVLTSYSDLISEEN